MRVDVTSRESFFSSYDDDGHWGRAGVACIQQCVMNLGSLGSAVENDDVLWAPPLILYPGLFTSNLPHLKSEQKNGVVVTGHWELLVHFKLWGRKNRAESSGVTSAGLWRCDVKSVDGSVFLLNSNSLVLQTIQTNTDSSMLFQCKALQPSYNSLQITDHNNRFTLQTFSLSNIFLWKKSWTPEEVFKFMNTADNIFFCKSPQNSEEIHLFNFRKSIQYINIMERYGGAKVTWTENLPLCDIWTSSDCCTCRLVTDSSSHNNNNNITY